MPIRKFRFHRVFVSSRFVSFFLLHLSAWVSHASLGKWINSRYAWNLFKCFVWIDVVHAVDHLKIACDNCRNEYQSVDQTWHFTLNGLTWSFIWIKWAVNISSWCPSNFLVNIFIRLAWSVVIDTFSIELLPLRILN